MSLGRRCYFHRLGHCSVLRVRLARSHFPGLLGCLEFTRFRAIIEWKFKIRLTWSSYWRSTGSTTVTRRPSIRPWSSTTSDWHPVRPCSHISVPRSTSRRSSHWELWFHHCVNVLSPGIRRVLWRGHYRRTRPWRTPAAVVSSSCTSA